MSATRSSIAPIRVASELSSLGAMEVIGDCSAAAGMVSECSVITLEEMSHHPATEPNRTSIQLRLRRWRSQVRYPRFQLGFFAKLQSREGEERRLRALALSTI